MHFVYSLQATGQQLLFMKTEESDLILHGLDKLVLLGLKPFVDQQLFALGVDAAGLLLVEPVLQLVVQRVAHDCVDGIAAGLLFELGREAAVGVEQGRLVRLVSGVRWEGVWRVVCGQIVRVGLI